MPAWPTGVTFPGGFWKSTRATDADLLWRVRADAILPCLERLDDGSFLSKLYPSVSARRRDEEGVSVRVVEYTLDGAVGEPQTVYRLVTSILDPLAGPAEDLADLYHQRWEIETAFDELKTHLRQVVLRSKTPDRVFQEFYGLLLAHYAVRGLMHEAALSADVDPDRLSSRPRHTRGSAGRLGALVLFPRPARHSRVLGNILQRVAPRRGPLLPEGGQVEDEQLPDRAIGNPTTESPASPEFGSALSEQY